MRNWAVGVLAVAALGAVAVVIAVATRNAADASGESPRELTEAIDDCQERIRSMERELQRLRGEVVSV